MPSAPDRVRAAARYVAPPVGEEGAAQVIEAARPRRSLGATERRAAGARWRGDGARAACAVGWPDAVGDDRPDRPRRRGRSPRSDRRLARAALVALPTDTVYGLGVALDAVGGLGRLFAAKHRPLDKGIVLLLADHHQADAAGIMTPAAHVLAAAFWPGGLTLVVPQRAEAGFPPELTGGAATIGLGCPPTTRRERWRRPSGPCPCHRPTGRASRRRSRPPRWSASSATARTCPRSRWRARPRRRRVDGRRLCERSATDPARRRRSRPMSSRRSSTRRGSSTRSGDDPGRRSGRAGTARCGTMSPGRRRAPGTTRAPTRRRPTGRRPTERRRPRDRR